MPFKFLFCPTFKSEFEKILGTYPKSEERIQEVISSLQNNPNQGNIYPGFGEITIRKVRIPLSEYKLSSSKGLRFIFLVSKEKNCLVPLCIYKKGAFKREQQVKEQIKNNLKNILKEIDLDQCTSFLKE